MTDTYMGSRALAGVKRVETRHWSTDYRGPLAIHASKRWTVDQIEFALVERELGRLPIIKVPLGALIAVCELVDVRPTSELKTQVSAIERIYGNYEPGRFGWLLENIRPLAEPIAFCGRQGFFNVPDELVRA